MNTYSVTSDGRPPFCERCGTSAPPSDAAGPSFCLGCRLYLCGACGLSGNLRCPVCRASATRPATAGIAAARDALDVLRAVERDARALADFNEPVAGLDPVGVDPFHELEVLQIKRRDAETAAEHALAAVPRQHRARAEEVRDQMGRTLARIELAAVVLLASAGGERDLPGWPAAAANHRRRNALIVSAATAAVAGVLAASVLWPQRLPTEPSSGEGETPTTTPVVRGAVAGGGSEPTPKATPTPAPEAWSFDEIEMGSGPPDGFRVRGPNPQLEVAAFPTAVDRSLRLRAVGASSGLCHDLAGGPSRISARVRLEGALLGGTVLIGLADADESQVVAAVLTASGALELRGERSVMIAPAAGLGRWYVLTLNLDPSGTATLVADDEDGSELGRATLPLGDRVETREVCFGLPSGGPATELYIDELTIAY